MKLPYYAFWLLLLVISACDTDIPNPNAATDEEALSSQQGLIALSIGMRQYYSTDALSSVIIAPGVTARELGAFRTFVNYLNLEEGGDAIQNDNSLTSNVWVRLYRVAGLAETIFESNTPELVTDDNIRAGVAAHALFFKAISLGQVILSFEQAPITTSADGQSPFVDRDQVLAEVIRLLTEAQSLLVANSPSDEFYNEIGSTLDLPNMIRAYLSRYQLIAGNYNEAIASAEAVDLSSISYFVYDAENENPIWDLLINGTDFRPLDNFGLAPSQVDAADGRLDFFLVPTDTTSAQRQLPVDDLSGYFNDRAALIPVYLPGEVLLNKAEAQARSGAIDEAIATLNQVRTKTNDPTGVNAALAPYDGPATAEAVLDNIYANRALELFLTGLRWEDSRRFDQPGPSADDPSRTRNFYPYPDTERANNENTPDDPEV